MSTTTPNRQPAPWRALFLSHLSTLPSSPEFTLSTLAPAPGTPTGYAPRARTCIHRGLWAHLPENKHNSVPRNPADALASDCLALTTDARMAKVAELFATGRGAAKLEEVEAGAAGKDEEREGAEGKVRGSGGGGPVEAVYWVAGDVMCQWRVRGQGWLVDAADIEDAARAGDSGVRAARSAVGARMRRVGGAEAGAGGEWSWKREVEAHWGNLSPGMRGTFVQPPPGQDKRHDVKEGKLGMGEKLDVGLQEAPVEARRHFRVLVVTPDEVEMVDLKDPSKAYRKSYFYDEAKGTWSEVEQWP